MSDYATKIEEILTCGAFGHGDSERINHYITTLLADRDSKIKELTAAIQDANDTIVLRDVLVDAFQPKCRKLEAALKELQQGVLAILRGESFDGEDVDTDVLITIRSLESSFQTRDLRIKELESGTENLKSQYDAEQIARIQQLTEAVDFAIKTLGGQSAHFTAVLGAPDYSRIMAFVEVLRTSQEARMANDAKINSLESGISNLRATILDVIADAPYTELADVADVLLATIKMPDRVASAYVELQSAVKLLATNRPLNSMANSLDEHYIDGIAAKLRKNEYKIKKLEDRSRLLVGVIREACARLSGKSNGETAYDIVDRDVVLNLFDLIGTFELKEGPALTNLRAKISVLEARIGTLCASHQERATRIGELETKIQSRDSKIAELRDIINSRDEESRTKIKDLKASRQELLHTVARFGTKIKGCETRITQLFNAVNNLIDGNPYIEPVTCVDAELIKSLDSKIKTSHPGSYYYNVVLALAKGLDISLALDSVKFTDAILARIKSRDSNNQGSKPARQYIRGANGRKELKSVPAGWVIMDEFEEAIVPLADERSSGQEDKQTGQEYIHQDGPDFWVRIKGVYHRSFTTLADAITARDRILQLIKDTMTL